MDSSSTIKPGDAYSHFFSSARISTLLPALTHVVGIGGPAVWTGILESVRVPEGAQERWCCSSVGYLDLFKHAAGLFPPGMITSGRFLPTQLPELADLVSKGRSLVIGPLDTNVLTGRVVPSLWSGAPVFAEMVGMEQSGYAVLRIFGAHAICSVDCRHLAPPQHHRISWIATSSICKNDIISVLTRMRTFHEPCIIYLTQLSGDFVALAEMIKRQGLSSVQKYCLKAGLRTLQEYLWDTYWFLKSLQLAGFAGFEDLLTNATARIWICLLTIAQGYSVLTSTESDIMKYITNLGCILGETPILSLASNSPIQH